MKLIATRNFRNTFAIDLNGDGRITKDENYVKKGTVFHIGKAEEPEALPKQELEQIALLNHAKCVGLASDAKLVKRIEAEVAAEKKAEEKAATAVAAGSNADVVQQLVAALQSLTGKGKKAAAE